MSLTPMPPPPFTVQEPKSAQDLLQWARQVSRYLVELHQEMQLRINTIVAMLAEVQDTEAVHHK